MINKQALRIIFIMLTSILLLTACVPVKAKHTLISSLESNYLYVYPLSEASITCTTADPGGDKLTYLWSCSDGSFKSGEGQQVIWVAPNKYGKFHIMVTVDNGLGLKDQETITIEVVVNENPVQCPACGR